MGLYRGITPMMIRDVLPYGIYMLVYEYMLDMEKRLYRKHDYENKVFGEAALTAFAGAVAGVVSWIFIVPFDVIKTVMQSETDPAVHKNMLECTSKLIQRHGYISLFRGSLMIIARAAPVNAVTFLGYEYCLDSCYKYFKLKQVEKYE